MYTSFREQNRVPLGGKKRRRARRALVALSLVAFSCAGASPARAANCMEQFAAALRAGAKATANTAEAAFSRLQAAWKEEIIPAAKELPAVLRREVEGARAWGASKNKTPDTVLLIPRIAGTAAVDTY